MSEKIDKLMKRCQIGCGGRNALDDCHDILAECYGTLGAMGIKYDRLLVLATKHCPREHHDWQEILKIAALDTNRNKL